MAEEKSSSSRRVHLRYAGHRTPPQGKVVGKPSPQQPIKVSVIVRRKNPLDLEKLPGRRISREEFAQNYAADPADFEKIRAFAQEHGLTVDEAHSSLRRRTIVLEGPAQAIENAFGVNLQDYEVEGRRFHSYTGTIQVPAEQSDIIEGVLGLDTRPIAKPHYRKLQAAAAANSSFTPPQVAQVYSFPTDVTGAGEAVGILEFGGGYNASQLQTYFQGLGISTPPTVTAVSVDGATNAPGATDGSDDEVQLDIEVVGSIATGAQIAVYFAPNSEQGFVDSVTTAVHDTTNHPSVISISWGGPEDSWSQQGLVNLNNAMQSAAALGITVTVASGDNGSSDGETGNHVDFPASSPYVLGCGGTQLQASNGQRQSETVWNDQAGGGGATGGGVSAMFPLPSWQANANVPAPPSSTGGRGVPDVAGDASPETGYQISVDGSSIVVGGTSAVAPLWAALLALVNQKRGSAVGFVNPALYQSGESAFFDITSGNNGSFSAGPGWDPCTGLGSPVGNLVENLLGSSGTTTG